MPPIDPITTDISSITTFGDSLVALFTAALPPTQNRIDAFKIRAARLYQRTRIRIEDKLYNTIIREVKEPITIDIITKYVDFSDNDLPTNEENDLIAVICARFGIIAK